MNCRETNKQLSAYLDGELPAAENARIEAHLAACDGCRQELLELRRLARGVAALPNAPVPAGFLADVQRKLEAAPAASPPVRDLFRPWWVKVAVRALAATAVVVGVVVLTRPPATLRTARTDEASAKARTAMAPSPTPAPTIVLEQPAAPATTAPEPFPAPAIAPSSGTGEQKWAAADRLTTAEEEARKTDLLARERLPDLRPAEPFKAQEADRAKAKLAAGKMPAPKPAADTVVVVSAEAALVQQAAAQVAQNLHGSASRVQRTPDGRMSFLHVEVPASQVLEFKKQFDRQCTALAQKTLTLPSRPERALAAPTAGLAFEGGRAETLREGLADTKQRQRPRNDADEAVEATKEMAFNMAGARGGTNPAMDKAAALSRTAGLPMVILEIQIKAPTP